MKIDKKTFLIGTLLFFGLIIASLPLFFFFLEPSSEVKSLQFSNQTDKQVTISWVTDKPTRSRVLVSSTGEFPRSLLFAKRQFKDDGEKRLKNSGFYLTHHVTAGGLSPNKTFYFRIYQGLKKVHEGKFTTGSRISSLASPNPVYGKVLLADKKSPLIGGLIYLQVEDKKGDSSLISTLTNTEGGWSLDLANLRSKDLKSGFKIATNSAEVLIVDSGTGKFKAESKIGEDKPWPNIITR